MHDHYTDVSETLSTVIWDQAHSDLTSRFATVDDHELKADIIFPPDLRPGIHPLIVTYHGGYLISGSRNHYPFMPGWLPGYAASESAVIVSPDYRLLPSATATEVRADLESFWSWLLETLPLVLTLHSPDHQIDLDRILLQGSSAGGFCVAHLALDHPDQIRAAIMVYPMLDCLSEYMANGPPNAVELAKEKGLWTGDELDEQVKKAKSAGWISERTDPQDFQLTRSMMKGGEFGKGFGSKENNPIDRIRQGVGIGFPSKV